MADHPFIASAFAEDIKPGWLIGQMLIGYGEIEYELASLLGAAYDPRMALRAMFRSRGETARIEVADSLLHPRCLEIGVKAKYEITISAVKFCKNVRNQYSHCHWHLEDGDLWFYNMESAAEGHPETIDFTFQHVNMKLLLEQLAYFNYSRYCLIHLQNQFGYHGGLKNQDPTPWPKAPQRPKKSNLKRKLSDQMNQEGPNTPHE